MTITLTNQGLGNPNHYTVKDIFFGKTQAEKDKWFISAKIAINLTKSTTIYYTYLTLTPDTEPPTFETVFRTLEHEGKGIQYAAIDRAVPHSVKLTINPQSSLSDITTQFLNGVASPNGQFISKLFIDTLDDTIANWDYDKSNNHPVPTPTAPTGCTLVAATLISTTQHSPKPLHKVYRASTTEWGHIPVASLNAMDLDIYYKGDPYAYNRWFALDANGTDLLNENNMSDPFTIDLWKQFCEQTPVTNQIDATAPNKKTHGHLIQRLSEIMGYRINDNGEIDRDKEKAEYIRTIEQNPQYPKGDYSVNGFGKKGTLLRHLPNSSRGVGGWERVHDIPQLVGSLLDQLDKSLGIQENANITLPIGERGRAKYHNLSAMQKDSAIALDELVRLTRELQISSLVTQSQTTEIIAGLGNNISTKFLNVQSEGHQGTVKIPYKAAVPTETTHKLLTEILMNIALIAGQIY